MKNKINIIDKNSIPNSFNKITKKSQIIFFTTFLVGSILSTPISKEQSNISRQELSNRLFLMNEKGSVFSDEILNSIYRFNSIIQEKILQPDQDPINTIPNSDIILDIIEHKEEHNINNMVAKANTFNEIINEGIENIDLSVFGFDENIEIGLKSFILGLIAQESSFNNNSKSTSNALGLFQITPSTYNSFKKKYKNNPNFSYIFEGNMNILLSSIEKQLMFYFLHAYEVNNTFIKSSIAELNDIKMNFFQNDYELFNSNFLVYVLLNSYNTGGNIFNKRNFNAFNEYLLNNFDENNGDPLYVFHELTLFLKDKRNNNYGKQAQSYAFNILSWQYIINNHKNMEQL